MKNEGKKLYPWALLLKLFKDDPLYSDESVIEDILTEIPDIPGARLPDDLPLLERYLCNILQPFAFLELKANPELIPDSVDETIPWNEMDDDVKEQYYQWRDQFSFDIYADSFPNIATVQAYKDKLSEIRNAHRPQNDTAPLTPSADAAAPIPLPELVKKYKAEISEIEERTDLYLHCLVYYAATFKKKSREDIKQVYINEGWKTPPALKTITVHKEAGKKYLCYAPNGPRLPPLDE